MKKIVLLWLIILMSSFVTYATNYVVISGAGVDDVNGVYLETGSNGYSPIYTKSPYSIEHLAGEVWVIGIRKPPPDNDLYEFTYYSRATGDNLPPTSGWTLEDDGINPAPTLTICLDWLHPSLTSAEITSSTSLIINGSISNTSLSDELVNYQFYYGTASDNLSQSTVIQSINVPARSSVNVNATLTGLTVETMYYFKLVVATNQSSTKKILLSITIPTANLKLHLRSDLAVTSTSSAVSNWGDGSGCDNDATQTTGGNQPTFVSNVINGNPALRFNGITTKMFLPTPETLGIEENPYEMFIVAKSSSSDIQFLIAGSSIERFEYHLNGVGARFIPVNSTYFDLGVAGSYTDGNAHLFSARASSSGGAVRVDGIDGGSSSSNILSSSGGNLLLGIRTGGAYPFNGDIAEVIIYNTVLSTEDRNAVEQYLADRYGITSGALPVELTSFTANTNENRVILNWQTATEVNSYGFDLEKIIGSLQSVTGRPSPNKWVKIGFVQGNGNSNSPKEYSFVEANPVSGKSYYRLKMIDMDGSFEYSKEVEVNTKLPSQFALQQNYPNPFNPTTMISYQLPINSFVSLKVYDVLGKEIVTLVNELKEAGTHSANFDASIFSSGVYFYKLQAGSFLQIKKMLLIR